MQSRLAIHYSSTRKPSQFVLNYGVRNGGFVTSGSWSIRNFSKLHTSVQRELKERHKQFHCKFTHLYSFCGEPLYEIKPSFVYYYNTRRSITKASTGNNNVSSSSSNLRTSSSTARLESHEHEGSNEDILADIPNFHGTSLSSLLMEDIDEISVSPDKIENPSNSGNNDKNQQMRVKHLQNKHDMTSLLSLFNATSPPNIKIQNQDNSTHTHKNQIELERDLHALQLWIECESQRESVSQYESILQSARDRKDYTSLKPVRRYLLKWYEVLRDAIEEEQRAYLTDARGKKDRVRYGAYLCTLQPEKMAVILAHIGITHALSQGGHGAKIAHMAIVLGEAVEAEVNVQRLLRRKVQERNLNNNVYHDTEIKKDVEDIESMQNHAEKNENDTRDILQNSTNQHDLFDNVTSTPEWMYGASHLARFVAEANKANIGKKTQMRIQSANRRALRLLQDQKESWTDMVKAKLGAALVQILLDNALLENGQPAFTYEKKWVGWNQSVGHVSIDENFYKMIVEDKYESLAPYSTRHKPMVTPPRDWMSPDDGGYHALQVHIMRTHGCRIQKNALFQANLNLVYEGLNSLGQVPWKINLSVLNIAQKCWDQGIVLGDIPSRTDLNLPQEPIRPEKPSKEMFENRESEAFKESTQKYMKYREKMLKYRKIYQKNMDLRSLRCSVLLKLNQAEKFKGFENIYFPYNLDFRGRAYPVPPHLSNVGSDLSRGLLKFSEAKPLGERGLYWLKVHIANLAGFDKVSFDERAAFTEKNISLIRDSVNNPLEGERWWMSCDDPFQALAACFEVVNAIDSGDPANYKCALPVHMDGSCNGLQHYAALGRDKVGGTAVNLCPCDKPQDVYSGVMREVIARVEEESKKTLDFDWDQENLSKGEKIALRNNKAAKLVDGLIDRGVVKRTVMTSVYGVTFIGAKQQIQEKIEEKLVEKGVDVDDIEGDIQAASSYLASVTMDVMGDLFQGARQTMNWLASCARLISAQGTPIAWVSPIGLPVVQPYRQSKPYTIVTLVQYMVLSNNTDNLPIHKSRQVTAFPPNYVHSLDSSHMILTALEMKKRGLTFSAVHDSFWTHAADVDDLNEALRDCFVDLYDKPLLEELKKTWELRYPSINFPDLPKRGDLDLNEVKDAPYFFQ